MSNYDYEADAWFNETRERLLAVARQKEAIATIVKVRVSLAARAS